MTTSNPLAGANPAPTEAEGQLWEYDEIGRFYYSDNLSDELRFTVRNRCRFRQFCNMPRPVQAVKGKGDTFNWNIHGGLETPGGEIAETQRLPKTRSTSARGSVTVAEFGNSVEFTEKLDNLSAESVREIIEFNLEVDCANALDTRAWTNFRKTPLKVTPLNGNDTSKILITENGTPGAVNDSALTIDHVGAMSLQARERNIPTYRHGDYYMIGRPTTYETVESSLDNIFQYTPEGLQAIRNGEKGRYRGVRFVEQTNIGKQTADFVNGESDEAFLFGMDAVMEASVIPEELRGGLPEDVGRFRTLAWYALLNFQIVREAANDARILHWTSAAA